MEQFKCLVVEDNEINCELAKTLIEELGLFCDTAYDGQEALDKITKASPAFDIIFMDVQMPVMDGITATKKLRENPAFKAVPVVAMTADSDDATVKAVEEAGMNGLLAKPFTTVTLSKTLSDFLPDFNGANPAKKSDQETEDTLTAELKELLKGSDFDAELGIFHCGSPKNLKKFLSNLAFLAPTSIATLQADLDNGDITDFRIKIHATKSSTLSLGNKKLSDMSKELEQLAIDGQLDEIKIRFEEFKNTFNEDYKFISQKFQDSGEKVAKKEPDMKAALEILDALLEGLSAFDIDLADKCLASLDEYDFSGQIADKLTWLKIQVTEVDFDRATKAAIDMKTVILKA